MAQEFRTQGDADVRIITNQSSSLVMIKQGKRTPMWFYSAAHSHHSLLAMLCYGPMQRDVSTGRLCETLSHFGLTILHVFRDNPEETSKFLEGLCGKLRISSKLASIAYTRANLQTLLNDLKHEPAALNTCKAIEDTIAALGVKESAGGDAEIGIADEMPSNDDSDVGEALKGLADAAESNKQKS